MKIGVTARLALVFCVAVGAVSQGLYGQIAGPTWVALDAQPPGTPPSVVVDRINSTEDQSVFNITIHGFYFEPINLPGIGNFRRLSLDPNGVVGMTMTPGRPELIQPCIRVAIPTDAPAVTPVVNVLNTTTLTGYDIFPAQSDFIEEEGILPVPPPTAHDEAFYGMNTTYPSTAAELDGVPELMYGVKTQGVRLNLFRANPGMHTLTIHRQVRVIVGHNGNALPGVEVTRRTSRLLAQALDNFAVVNGGYVLINQTAYQGEYLIITPQQWIDSGSIAPLAQQKAERGYRVTVRTTEFIGDTQQEIYNNIDAWYHSRPSGADCYVLLVGDTDQIPLGFSPRHGANVSDYAYACHPLGSTSQQDLYLGRLSVSSTTELNRIINRIMTYQDNPASSTRYDNVLLAAHNQTSNGYVNCINEIADFGSYLGSTPQFLRRRGSQSDGTVGNVIADMANGQGVVLYRGHGGGRSWSHWDFNDDSLEVADVNSMDINFVRPVVFSVACTNSQIDRAGEVCISEAWHRRLNGAVAHVGGSRSTWTTANHTYAKSIAFWTYFPSAAPTISMVIDIAGLVMAFNHSGCGWDNRYLYLLQGDPEMLIWRENPATTSGLAAALRGTLPEWLPPGQHTLNYVFETTGGNPVVGAIVAAFKEGEVQVNGYTDALGEVSLTVNPATCGELVLRAYSDLDSIRGQRLVIPIAISGDANRDGEVNFADITNVLENWGMFYVTIPGDGDANLSHAVNFSDVTAVLRSFGDSCN